MKTKYDEQLGRLNQVFTLNEATRDRMYRKVVNSKRKTHSLFLPRVMAALLTIFVFGTLYILFFEESNGTITDPLTPETLPYIEQPENAFLLEWFSDDMDRGNREMITSYHTKLVVSREFQPLARGDVVYYKFKGLSRLGQGDGRLGRVVGLPGETVEIKGGQVYIDGKKLDTFYGAATVRGKREEEYFKAIEDSDHWVNIPARREYFNTSMDPVTVKEGTVFVLIDHWWRGYDSKTLGLIPYEAIQGKVLGYKK